MRIFIIHNFYQHAGGEDAVFQQEVHALSEEHQVETFTCQNKKGFKGIQQYLSYPFNIREAKKIAQRVAVFKPDVVHIHNLHYGLGPWLIRQIYKLGVPVVMTLHNYRLLCPSATLFFAGQLFRASLQENFPWTAVKNKVLDHSFLKTFLTGFTYWWHRRLGTWNQVARYIVLSDFAKNNFVQSTFPVPAERFTVRPNAVDVERSQQERTHTFIYIGRLSEEKGIIPLLQAIADTSFTLKVFGTGPQQALVEELQAQYTNIEYMGFHSQERLRKELETATALIVPSVCYEGMPMSILEAFAKGTPVVASNIGILQEMVVPLFTGLSFDPYQKESIKRALAEWIALSQAQKEEIGNNCRQVYEKNYTVAQNMHRLMAIYQEVQIKN